MNLLKVIPVGVEEVLRQIDQLDVAGQKAVLNELHRRLVVPLHNPVDFFDDWDDREVDRVYDPPR